MSEMEIDWDEQWRLHAPDYRDGYVVRTLPGCDRVLKMEPGPGFGDCSHPTTRLMLSLMEGRMAGASVLDMGTGSGVLAVSAALMGAKSVEAVDIDPDAVRHARRSADMNAVDVDVTTVQSWEPARQSYAYLLFNMTYGEQAVAWQQMDIWKLEFQHILLSGLLVEQAEAAAQELRNRGWLQVELISEGEWCALRLEKA